MWTVLLSFTVLLGAAYGETPLVDLTTAEQELLAEKVLTEFDSLPCAKDAKFAFGQACLVIRWGIEEEKLTRRLYERLHSTVSLTSADLEQVREEVEQRLHSELLNTELDTDRFTGLRLPLTVLMRGLMQDAPTDTLLLRRVQHLVHRIRRSGCSKTLTHGDVTAVLNDLTTGLNNIADLRTQLLQHLSTLATTAQMNTKVTPVIEDIIKNTQYRLGEVIQAGEDLLTTDSPRSALLALLDRMSNFEKNKAFEITSEETRGFGGRWGPPRGRGGRFGQMGQGTTGGYNGFNTGGNTNGRYPSYMPGPMNVGGFNSYMPGPTNGGYNSYMGNPSYMPQPSYFSSYMPGPSFAPETSEFRPRPMNGGFSSYTPETSDFSYMPGPMNGGFSSYMPGPSYTPETSHFSYRPGPMNAGYGTYRPTFENSYLPPVSSFYPANPSFTSGSFNPPVSSFYPANPSFTSGSFNPPVSSYVAPSSTYLAPSSSYIAPTSYATVPTMPPVASTNVPLVARSSAHRQFDHETTKEQTPEKRCLAWPALCIALYGKRTVAQVEPQVTCPAQRQAVINVVATSLLNSVDQILLRSILTDALATVEHVDTANIKQFLTRILRIADNLEPENAAVRRLLTSQALRDTSLPTLLSTLDQTIPIMSLEFFYSQQFADVLDTVHTTIANDEKLCDLDPNVVNAQLINVIYASKHKYSRANFKTLVIQALGNDVQKGDIKTIMNATLADLKWYREGHKMTVQLLIQRLQTGQPIWDVLEDTLIDIKDDVIGDLSRRKRFLGSVTKWVSDAASTVANTASNAVNTVGNWASGAANTIAQATESTWNTVKNKIHQAPSWFSTFFKYPFTFPFGRRELTQQCEAQRLAVSNIAALATLNGVDQVLLRGILLDTITKPADLSDTDFISRIRQVSEQLDPEDDLVQKLIAVKGIHDIRAYPLVKTLHDSLPDKALNTFFTDKFEDRLDAIEDVIASDNSICSLDASKITESLLTLLESVKNRYTESNYQRLMTSALPSLVKTNIQKVRQNIETNYSWYREAHADTLAHLINELKAGRSIEPIVEHVLHAIAGLIGSKLDQTLPELRDINRFG